MSSSDGRHSHIKTAEEVLALLDELDVVIAEDLEDDTLDFKACPTSRREMMRFIYEGVLCFANAQGGTLVLGVNDRLATPSRRGAIGGVPIDLDLDLIQRQIYDTTDPRITPTLEPVSVPEGRLLLIHIPRGTPPYTSTQVSPTSRVGRNCVPLTGSLIRATLERSSQPDFTARTVRHVDPLDFVSPAEMERLRNFGRENRAPADLLGQGDSQLLASLGLVREGRLTYAGVLLVGRHEVLRDHVPTQEWRYAKMRSETDIDVPAGGSEPILAALEKLETLINASNPVTTLEIGFFHPEFRTYPTVALREALLNAFVHRDYGLAGPVQVKLYPSRLEIGNLGGFIGGITPDNVLNHPPAHRNPALADALEGLNLVNRRNLGVKRIYHSLLREGKEPPVYSAAAQSVRLTFHAHTLDRGFLRLLSWLLEEAGRDQGFLSAGHLLVLHHLKRHREADLLTLASAAQLETGDTREHLAELERLGALEHAGTGRGTFYRLTRASMDQLGGSLGYDRDRRLEWEAIKTRVLSVLAERPLRNRDIRELCDLDRKSVVRLMDQLRTEGLVEVSGLGRNAQWRLV